MTNLSCKLAYISTRGTRYYIHLN